MATNGNDGQQPPQPPAAQGPSGHGHGPAGPPPKRPGMPQAWWLAAGLLIAAVVFFLTVDTTPTVNESDLFRLLDAGQVKKLVFVGKQRAEGEIRDKEAEPAKSMKLTGGKFTLTLPNTNRLDEYGDKLRVRDLTAQIQARGGLTDDQRKDIEQSRDPASVLPKLQAILKQKAADAATMDVDFRDEPPQFLGPLLWTLVPLLVFIAFFVFVLLPRIRDPGGGGFLNNYIRSPAKKYEKNRGRITFEDVAGMEPAKRELQEIVDFLRNPDKFTRLGAQVPKGVLLVGPPGTGKTLLAKAVAGEANVPFYAINGSEFIQMFVGVGASRVRDLFKTAKETAPCVIFIDEIDAVGRMRGAGVGGGSDEREQTLNQILSEMDGFAPAETVIVLAATNRPDVLDAALLRPGRFDRHVTVDRPTWQGRLAILKVHTKTKPLADNVDLEKIARAMIGMSGADLRNLCNEAALVATREGKNQIEQIDFDIAGDRVRLGAKRDEPFSDEEKRRTAYHEAGHALCAWLEPKADPLTRVSIVPRGQSGGVTIFSPDEDRVDRAYSEYMARLVVAMGGRAADKLIFGEPLSGAIQDIRMATRIARAMVTQYGMSEKLGPVHYRQSEDHVFLGKEIVESREFSEGTARIIDEEVQRILTTAEARATELCARNKADLDALASALLVHEELDREAVEKLLRKAPPVEGEERKPDATPEAGKPSLAFGGM